MSAHSSPPATCKSCKKGFPSKESLISCASALIPVDASRAELWMAHVSSTRSIEIVVVREIQGSELTLHLILCHQ